MSPIPAPVRREVATREGVVPGERTTISCHWCGDTTVATWPLRLNGKPTYWPLFGAFHLDHVHPRAKGGRDVATNLVVSCMPCNSSKRDRDVPEWLQKRSGVTTA